MKTIMLPAFALLFLQAVLLGGDDKKPELKTTKDKASYALGINIGKSLKAQALDVDLTLLLKGLQDSMGGEPLLADTECREVIMAYQKEARSASIDKNKKEGETFLAENKAKPGIVTLPSGLQYKVITAGTGEKPKPTDKVKTHYRGTLISGKEFDSSYKRGEPATFGVTQVIKGWTEALQLMPVGSKWQLYIPSELAYGERGAGADIGPNSTLIFDIELISIEK